MVVSEVMGMEKIFLRYFINGKERRSKMMTWETATLKMQREGASLVAQWLRICLPMQGTWVRALVWEDPTCHGATGPVSHNY